MALFRSPVLHCAVIVLLGIIIYFGVVKNEFVYDDFSYIENNYQIRSFRYLPLMLVSSYPPGSEKAGLYRPITTISYLVDYNLWGLNSSWFHFTNLILYILSCITLWFFMRQLTGNRYLSWIVTLVFTAHPVHTESVSWTVGRTAILAAIFFMVYLMCYLYWRQKAKANIWLIILMPVLYFLALGSYESAVALPLVIMLLDFIKPETGLSFIDRTKRNLLPIYLPLIGVTIIYIVLRLLALGRLGPIPEEQLLRDIGLVRRLAVVPIIYLKNFLLMLFPFKLTIAYKPTFSELFMVFPFLLGIILLAVIIYLAFYLRNRKPLMSFGLFFIIVSILPVSNLVPIGIVISERTLFLPSIGFCLVVGSLLELLWNREKMLWQEERNVYFLGLLIIILIFYGARTMARGKEWRDPYALWTTELKYYPNLPVAHNNLGSYFWKKGMADLAEQHYRKAIELDKEHTISYLNLAKLYVAQSRTREAQEILGKTLKLKPDKLGGNYAAIGSLYLEMGMKAEATKAYQMSLSINPRNPEALLEMGTLMLESGEHKLAEDFYTRALLTNLPENKAYILNNRAILYDKIGETEKAKEDLKRAMRISPEISGPYLKLAEIYAREGNVQLAIELLRKGIKKADPPSLSLNLYLAQIYESLGLSNEAMRILEQCRQSNPSDPRIYVVAGKIFAKAGRYKEALTAYQQAITIAPRYPAGYERAGDLLATMGKDKEAQRYWQRALELDPENTELQEKLNKSKTP